MMGGGGNAGNICSKEEELLKLIRANLVKQRESIDKKIEALDTVLSIFGKGPEDNSKPEIQKRKRRKREDLSNLTEAEKKERRKKYLKDYLKDKKKKEELHAEEDPRDPETENINGINFDEIA